MSATEPPNASVTHQPVVQPLDASNLLITRMADEHVQGVMAIESVSFGSHHWSHDSFYNEMRNQMARYYVLLDTKTHQVLGYCGFWLILDESHITTVAVRPDLRGNALGELLLCHILDRCMASSIKWVTLEVRVSNAGAQNLYYKYGFAAAGLRSKYYQNNDEDAMIMTTPDINSDEFRVQLWQHKATLTERLGGLPRGYDKS